MYLKKLKNLSIVTMMTFMCINAIASRSLYVDDFDLILNDTLAEDSLLEYSKANEFNTLLLYDLHKVNVNHSLTSTSSNHVLADFIKRAKTEYDIEYVGAVAENSYFFTNIIDVYNISRTNSSEKIDIYNFEFEFWNNSYVEPGGYYCNSYLSPNSYPCTTDGAFQYCLSALDIIDSLAINNSHDITTEAYVGWITSAQADTLGKKVDKLLVHAFVEDPNTAFSYVTDRLLEIANTNPGLDVSIVYSAEQEYMKDWLESNSINAAEDIFTNLWTHNTSNWANNITLLPFTYFAYPEMKNISISIPETTDIEENKVIEKNFNISNNVISFKNIQTVKEISIINLNGQKIKSSSQSISELNINDLTRGIYFLTLNFGTEVKTHKFIKQ